MLLRALPLAACLLFGDLFLTDRAESATRNQAAAGPTVSERRVAAADKVRVEVRVDAREAEVVLDLLAMREAGKAIAPGDWERLFATEGFTRLEERERAMGRPFTREEFQALVLSPELTSRAPALRRTLAAWSSADRSRPTALALAYLPPAARLHATVYPVIKPRTNSFVFDLASRPAIFLYLDPALSREQFENIVAHELHHIGTGSLESDVDNAKRLAALTPQAREAAKWMGAFGEGLAMLAAAGDANTHPHALSDAKTRARWDRDAANFAVDLRRVETFLLDVVRGRLTGKAIAEGASAFYGEQGPWYTVGWKMASLVEQTEGRARVIDAVRDPRQLLAAYNRVVRAKKLDLPLWSPELLQAVGVPEPAA